MDKTPETKTEEKAELDADIREKVTEIIAQGNAEELTVKKVGLSAVANISLMQIKSHGTMATDCAAVERRPRP